MSLYSSRLLEANKDNPPLHNDPSIVHADFDWEVVAKITIIIKFPRKHTVVITVIIKFLRENTVVIKYFKGNI